MVMVMKGDFLVRCWDVSVHGYGQGRVVAVSRGKALAEVWRSSAFGHLSFASFLKIARCRKSEDVPPNFGDQITVGGEAAYFVGRDRQYVSFVSPMSGRVLSSHPLDVLPESYRPRRYTTA